MCSLRSTQCTSSRENVQCDYGRHSEFRPFTLLYFFYFFFLQIQKNVQCDCPRHSDTLPLIVMVFYNISGSFRPFTFISFFPKSPSLYPPSALSKAGHRPKVIQYPRAEENSISTLQRKSNSRAEKCSVKKYFFCREMFSKKVFPESRNVL